MHTVIAGRRVDPVGDHCLIIRCHKPGERQQHWETAVEGLGWAPPYMGRVLVLTAGQRVSHS